MKFIGISIQYVPWVHVRLLLDYSIFCGEIKYFQQNLFLIRYCCTHLILMTCCFLHTILAAAAKRPPHKTPLFHIFPGLGVKNSPLKTLRSYFHILLYFVTKALHNYCHLLGETKIYCGKYQSFLRVPGTAKTRGNPVGLAEHTQGVKKPPTERATLSLPVQTGLN